MASPHSPVPVIFVKYPQLRPMECGVRQSVSLRHEAFSETRVGVNKGTLREEKVHVEREWAMARKALRWLTGLGSLSTIFFEV